MQMEAVLAVMIRFAFNQPLQYFRGSGASFLGTASKPFCPAALIPLYLVNVPDFQIRSVITPDQILRIHMRTEVLFLCPSHKHLYGFKCRGELHESSAPIT